MNNELIVLKRIEKILLKIEGEMYVQNATLQRVPLHKYTPGSTENSQLQRPIVICLCGSGRFKEAFEQATFDATLAGKIVLSIGCNVHDKGEFSRNLAEQNKSMLDELHLRKIDLADEVLILNVGGYIGESTAKELKYARCGNKKILFLENNEEEE